MRIPQFTLEPYWSTPLPQLFKEYVTSEHGLTQVEVDRRTVHYGKNQIQVRQKLVWKILLGKFTNPLILILFFANGISAFLGEITSAVIIGLILLLSIFLDFFQEYQATSIADTLKKRVSLTAMVLRDGIMTTAPAIHLTYGDVILLAPGNIVPADCRLIKTNELQIDQSMLTGESVPQLKSTRVEKMTTPVGEQLNVVFMGTVVVGGQGLAVVTRIGQKTQLGIIGHLLSQSRPKTEFEIGVERFGFFLLKMTSVLVLFVFFSLTFFKHDILQSFLFALAIAIGLTPELLPMITTVTLSKGAMRMANKGVIVKDLASIQNLGSIDVLCTDKTGTLTEGNITLDGFEDLDQKQNQLVFDYAWLNSTFQTTIRNFLDAAILSKTPSLKPDQFSKQMELQYDYHRKRVSVAVLHRSEQLLITKGMAESVLEICSSARQKNRYIPLNAVVRQKISDRITELNKKGVRVLAVATKTLETKIMIGVRHEEKMTFEGLLLFKDEPKTSAAEALRLLEQHQVEIKILTGDNSLVTSKICKELNLEVKGILTSNEMRHLSESHLLIRTENTTIFSDLTPEDKQRIVTTLRKGNQVVGFLGDGMNDAPSLRASDVGISVNNGTDIAKESADLILMHKDLRVLKDGVIEGRKTHANIMKYIMMGTSSNFGNMLSMSAAALVLPFLPLLPIQLLLNDLLYDVSQLALASDHVDAEDLRKPHRWDLKFIQRFMLFFGPVSSVFDVAAGAVLLLALRATPEMFRTGVFVESLLTQSFILFSIRTSKVPFLKSKTSGVLLLSMFLIISAGILLPISPVASLFQFVRLPLQFYAILAVLIVIYFLIVERLKKWFYAKVKEKVGLGFVIKTAHQ